MRACRRQWPKRLFGLGFIKPAEIGLPHGLERPKVKRSRDWPACLGFVRYAHFDEAGNNIKMYEIQFLAKIQGQSFALTRQLQSEINEEARKILIAIIQGYFDGVSEELGKVKIIS